MQEQRGNSMLITNLLNGLTQLLEFVKSNKFIFLNMFIIWIA